MARSSEAINAYNDVVDAETGVYINKLGITDKEELESVETRLVQQKSANRPRLKSFILQELQAVHKHLFEDLYDWAGKIRNYPTGRGSAPFALPNMIASSYERLTSQLKVEKYLTGLCPGTFANRSAYYVNELNAIHPFVEGNGRITRIYLQDLGEKAGHKISLKNIEGQKTEWHQAAKHGFHTASEEFFVPLIKTALLPELSQDKKALLDEVTKLLEKIGIPKKRIDESIKDIAAYLRSYPDSKPLPSAQRFIAKMREMDSGNEM